MSISAGKMIVKGKEVVTKEETVAAPTPKPKPTQTINSSHRFDKNKTYLVVNGQIKEISPKSKYLLDMLIIEKEDN